MIWLAILNSGGQISGQMASTWNIILIFDLLISPNKYPSILHAESLQSSQGQLIFFIAEADTFRAKNICVFFSAPVNSVGFQSIRGRSKMLSNNDKIWTFAMAIYAPSIFYNYSPSNYIKLAIRSMT